MGLSTGRDAALEVREEGVTGRRVFVTVNIPKVCGCVSTRCHRCTIEASGRQWRNSTG